MNDMFKTLYVDHMMFINKIFHSRLSFLKHIIWSICEYIFEKQLIRSMKKMNFIQVVLNYIYLELYIQSSSGTYETKKSYKVSDKCTLTVSSRDLTKMFSYKMEIITNSHTIVISSTSNPVGEVNSVDIIIKSQGVHFNYYANSKVEERYEEIMNVVEKIFRDYIKDIIMVRFSNIPFILWME